VIFVRPTCIAMDRSTRSARLASVGSLTELRLISCGGGWYLVIERQACRLSNCWRKVDSSRPSRWDL